MITIVVDRFSSNYHVRIFNNNLPCCTWSFENQSQLVDTLKLVMAQYGDYGKVYFNDYNNGDERKNFTIKEYFDHITGVAKDSNQKIVAKRIGDYFSVKFKYSPMIVGVIKKIQGRKFIKEEKAWTIPLDRRDELNEQMREYGIIVDFI
jgi:hypothetical protein